MRLFYSYATLPTNAPNIMLEREPLTTPVLTKTVLVRILPIAGPALALHLRVLPPSKLSMGGTTRLTIMTTTTPEIHPKESLGTLLSLSGSHLLALVSVATRIPTPRALILVLYTPQLEISSGAVLATGIDFTGRMFSLLETLPTDFPPAFEIKS